MMLSIATSLILAGSAVGPLPGLDAITPLRYPDAHSVIAERRERVEYFPSGAWDSRVETWTKVLTEKGRREERTITLGYSRRYGEAAIEYVGIISTNGVERVVDIGATTKESTDNGAMSANIYDPLDRQIVTTVPDLAIGETLHVKFRRREVRPRCQQQWADLAVFEWSDPIVRSTYEVKAPAALPLKAIRLRHPLGNLTTNVTRAADGDCLYTFTATNSPQAMPEPDMPSLHTVVEHVRLSTAADWQEISRWYWNLSLPHLQKSSPAMSNEVQRLVTGTNRIDNLRRIFRFVSQEIRYMGLTLEDVSPGYAPHDVDLTFANRYGVCRDKAALLVAMLRIAGFKAFPVLIQVGAKLDPEVPQPFFNHAIVGVEAPEAASGYILMDPTDENTQELLPAYLSNRSYLVCRPEGEALKTTAVPDPLDNAVTVASTGALADDGAILLTSELKFGGINDNAYRHALIRKQPADRIKTFERILKAAATGAELVSCQIEPTDLRNTEVPLKVKLTARLPEGLINGHTRQLVNAPFISSHLGVANFLLEGSLTLPQRKYPLVLGSTAAVVESFRLDLGGTIGRALELPRAEIAVGQGYRAERYFTVTNGQLIASRTLQLGALEFTPKEYGDLREAVKETEAAERRRPVFERDLKAEADVWVILNQSEVQVASDTEWVMTNRIIKQVLTYEGKKKSSELSWSFNPTWKRVELLSATVSNVNGQVHTITPKELNLMDAGWVAASPRYPASKLLVANLPAVEIGSVIDYRVAVTVTKAPASFYASYQFDSHEPVERIRVRVNDWQREALRPWRIKNEPSQPIAAWWRDTETVSFNSFVRAAARLQAAEPSPLAEGQGRTLKEIRDTLSRSVKIVGPSLYEIPLALQLTDPKQVLKERYASRLDYVRTLVALLKGAGYEASLVLATDDADDPEWLKRRTMYDKPNVRAFAAPLARVQFEGRTLFLGTESEYAPLGVSDYAGSSYLDPATGEFGVIAVAEEFKDQLTEQTVYEVREDGAVDLTVENRIYGSGVAAFRRTYAEILPEKRFRRYQAILGEIAQAATATSELETDVTSYPATRRFSCYIPDFAAVEGDTMTLTLPALVSSLPPLTGSQRVTPFALAPAEAQTETVWLHFPPGWTLVDECPEDFVFADPLDPGRVWMRSEVHKSINDDRLTIKLVREVLAHPTCNFASKYHELLKEWQRRASSAKSRTLVIRRANRIL